MQLEIIVVLIAYLFVVFGLSIYAMRKRSTGNFLSEYSSAVDRWGVCISHDPHRHLY